MLVTLLYLALIVSAVGSLRWWVRGHPELRTWGLDDWSTALLVGVLSPALVPLLSAMLAVSGAIQLANWLWIQHVYPRLFGEWRPHR